MRLTGEVSLENNGGFIQMALDLSREGVLNASAYRGLRLLVRGNGEEYNAHLRTPDTVRPWQSYRASFNAPDTWHEVHLPFAQFKPYRLDAPLDVSRLRRLGLVAIGRPFQADLCVAEISLY
ncbi:MAG: CIA30 family protein [Candidatus Competibacteraceae bacterium]